MPRKARIDTAGSLFADQKQPAAQINIGDIDHAQLVVFKPKVPSSSTMIRFLRHKRLLHPDTKIADEPVVLRLGQKPGNGFFDFGIGKSGSAVFGNLVMQCQEVIKLPQSLYP